MNKDFNRAVGQNIKRLREEHNLDQKDFCLLYTSDAADE